MVSSYYKYAFCALYESQPVGLASVPAFRLAARDGRPTGKDQRAAFYY